MEINYSDHDNYNHHERGIENKIKSLYDHIDMLREEFIHNGVLSDNFLKFLEENKYCEEFVEDLLLLEKTNKTQGHSQKSYYFTFYLAIYEDENQHSLFNPDNFSFPKLNLDKIGKHDRVANSLKIKEVKNDENKGSSLNNQSLLINVVDHYSMNKKKNIYQEELENMFIRPNDTKDKLIMTEIINHVDSYKSMIFYFCFLLRFFLKVEFRIQILKNNEEEFLFIDITSDKDNFYNLAKENELHLQIKYLDKSYEVKEKKKKKFRKIKMKEDDLVKFDEYNNEKPDFYTPHLRFSERNERFFILYKTKNDKVHVCDNCFNIHKLEEEISLYRDDEHNGECSIQFNAKCYADDNYSILRNIDKERLILNSIKTLVKINLINSSNKEINFFKKTFILHNYGSFEKNTFTVSNIYDSYKNPSSTKKSKEMNRNFRNFYGENVGFYFSWLSHYIEWLYIPVFLFVFYYTITIFLLIVSRHNEYIVKLSYITSFILSFLLMFWGNTFIQSWTATQKFINYSWGMDSYKAEYSDSNLTGTTLNYLDVKIPSVSKFKMYIFRILSFSIIVVFIAISIIVNLGIFYVENLHIYVEKLTSISIKNAMDRNWLYIAPTIIYLFREILSYFFGYVVPYVVELEYHYTKKSKQNSIIMKSFFFQFFNYYFIFYYIAFIKKYYSTCVFDDCYEELSITVKMILFLTILGDLFDLLILLFVKKNYGKIKQKSETEFEEQNHNPIFLKNDKYLYLIKNLYEGESITIEYISIIMNYGYIIQFGSVSPLCFFLAMVQGMISRIFDAIKFGNIYYIGFIEGSNGIEIFNKILKILTFFGFTSSILINIFTNTQYALLDNTTKWILAFIFENFCVFVLFFWKIDFLPSWFCFKDKIKANIKRIINDFNNKLDRKGIIFGKTL